MRLTLGHDEVLRADKIQIFKLVVKTIARKHGLYATFMAKPKFGIAGSGDALQYVLVWWWREQRFLWSVKRMQLSETAYYFLVAIKHACNYTAIMNPTVRSYKRLVPGYEAPVASPRVVVTVHRVTFLLLVEMGARLELLNRPNGRNPYIAMAILWKLVCTVLKTKSKHQRRSKKTSISWLQKSAKRLVSLSLPSITTNALRPCQKTEAGFKAALGEHIYTSFLEAKRTSGQASTATKILTNW